MDQFQQVRRPWATVQAATDGFGVGPLETDVEFLPSRTPRAAYGHSNAITFVTLSLHEWKDSQHSVRTTSYCAIYYLLARMSNLFRR